MVQQFSRRQLIAVDCVVAVVYTALLAGRGDGWPGLLVVGMGLPVAVRRIWPVPVLLVVGTLSLVALGLGSLRDPFLATSYALYTVAVSRNGAFRTRGLLGTAGVTGAIVLLFATVGGTPASSGRLSLATTGLAGLAATWLLGEVVRERRAAAAQAVRQAAEQAVYDERLRIARELHDIVAHSMGLIAVKAGVANHLVKARPEEASDALSVIETTSREAMVELRHMLGLLRTPGDPAVPAGGLAVLPELVERIRSTGLAVDLQVTATGLPDGIELAVQRIVQECLTNVAKHARARRCRVVVEAARGTVRVEVTDDGMGGEIGSEGHGLVGIRERAAVYNGTFEAGPLPGGGFRVAVELRR